MQIDALKQAGCERLYVEKASGAHRDRPRTQSRARRTCVPATPWWSGELPRLARSLKQIIETAHEKLEQKKQALKVLNRNIDTGTNLTGAPAIFPHRQPPSTNFSVS